MVAITFPDRETAKKAVGFLLGRYSGRLLKSGECIVPEAALDHPRPILRHWQNLNVVGQWHTLA